MSEPPRSPRFPLDLMRLKVRSAGRSMPPKPAAPSARATAAGTGLDSDTVRRRMVERLRADGNADPVLAAFAAVPRHRFVDTALVQQAYEDTSLPIGFGQTISKPSVVARMLTLLFDTDAARARGSLGRVLEIGTGCGYQAALLALLASRVLSVERLQPMFDKAATNLADRRADHRIRLVWGDGRHGHPPWAPYDSIVSAAGGEDLPQTWIDQLAVGGRLVAPVFDAARGEQSLLVIDRGEHGSVTRRRFEGVRFVPLKSGVE